MALSFQARRPVATASAATIADGIAVREPVPFAVDCMTSTVDGVVMVPDSAILAAMRLAWRHLRRVVEPAGAAGLAGIMQDAAALRGARVASVLCGANLTPEQVAAWLPEAA
jgi:threonine dehydratase